MKYITESLKISAQGVPKTQLKEYQIQSQTRETKTSKLKKRATLLHNNSQAR